MNITKEKGNISIHTENIFPIIKKFLYSDHEIFLRELISNAVDATQKINRLASIGEYTGEVGDTKIEISFDKKKKTITINDNGIGMTVEEIKKYINQIAFSGATEFIKKYKDKGDEQKIIGHFGLGFYSSFMVANNVEIESLSYKKDAQAAKWICDGSTEYEISKGNRKKRGTEIILYINEDSEEFLNKARIQGILDKYCKFLPIEIKFEKKDIQVEDGKEKDNKVKYKTVKVDNIINNPFPLWTKSPSELKDEDYLNFYKELYPFSEEPLFWIHLNVDYPFNLTGVLYFPKIDKNNFEINKNKIQLYSRQVFITDEVKDVVPEFLMLIHGVIDSPDIPLNVSRSFLQADGNVKKINTYITKKVADKLGDLFKKDRKSYEKKWSDIGLFVKYGMLSEEKFYERAKDFVLFENIEENFFLIEEYKEKIKINQEDKDKKLVILYTNDIAKQHVYIKSAKNKSYDVVKFDGILDSHFINHLEQKLENINLKRVDSDTIDKLINKDEKIESILSDKEKENVKKLFEKIINDKNSTVTVESLATDEMPVVVTMPEFIRRMKDMQKTGGGMMPMMGNFPDHYNVAINANHSIVSKILKAKETENKEKLARQAYDLALLSQNMLSGAALTDFIKRSIEISAE